MATLSYCKNCNRRHSDATGCLGSELAKQTAAQYMTVAKQLREQLRLEAEQRYPPTWWTWIGVDKAQGLDRTVVRRVPAAPPPCDIATAAFDKKPEADRIWDLIVLAARASRYGDA